MIWPPAACGPQRASAHISTVGPHFGKVSAPDDAQESAEQIKMRADRVDGHSGDCLILTETRIEHILNQAKEIEPSYLVIDSIQLLQLESLGTTSGWVLRIIEFTYVISLYGFLHWLAWWLGRWRMNMKKFPKCTKLLREEEARNEMISTHKYHDWREPVKGVRIRVRAIL